MKLRSIIDDKKKAKVRDAIAKGDTSIFGKKKKGAEEPAFLLEKLVIKKQKIAPELQAELNKQLLYHVAKNDIEKVKEALVNGADINTEGPVLGNDTRVYLGEYTALLIAALENNADMVRLLLANGANADVRDEFGLTIMMHAAREGCLEAVKILFLKVRDVDDMDNGERTALMFAAGNGNVKVAEFLLSKGADINRNGRNGTALYNAAVNGKMEMVDFLVSNGADVNAKVDGSTILAHVMCTGKCQHIERCLLLHGAREWIL